MERIRILIADDHVLIREGFRTLVSTEPAFEIVGEAEDGAEAVQKAIDLHPDVILMDIVMPGVDGIEATRQIKQKMPEARILVLTSFDEDDKVFPAIKAGALGYLLKDTSPRQLINAILNVYHGESSLDPGIALRLIQEINQPADLPPTESPLTSRELEVIKLIAQGLGNAEIAERLVIREMTVGSHVRNILAKLHLANRTQAALYALREGLAKL